jgi:16S rRNA (guanine966-N2)-methyltransferase
LRAIGQTKIYRRDATKMGPANGDPYNLIFLDPPYGKSMGQAALSASLEGGWLSDDALCVWEENTKQIPPTGFTMLDARKYGDTWVHILEVA